MGKLFEELKRRKVFRVAAVYGVVAYEVTPEGVRGYSIQSAAAGNRRGALSVLVT